MHLSPLNHRGLAAAVGSSKALWILNRIEERHGSLRQCHEAVQRRLMENHKIQQAWIRDEPIAVVWSGMDCDGVKYAGDVRWIPPYVILYNEGGKHVPSTLAEFQKAVRDHIEHTYHWADGPCGYALLSEAEVKAFGIKYESRDMGMEAFENGHAHCIHI